MGNIFDIFGNDIKEDIKNDVDFKNIITTVDKMQDSLERIEQMLRGQHEISKDIKKLLESTTAK